MADQLGVNNVQRQLIGSQRPQQPRRPAVNKNSDVVVVNASEKRYLWTARAFAVIVAISLCCNLVLILAFPLKAGAVLGQHMGLEVQKIGFRLFF